jgi:hypothetical protein
MAGSAASGNSVEHTAVMEQCICVRLFNKQWRNAEMNSYLKSARVTKLRTSTMLKA